MPVKPKIKTAASSKVINEAIHILESCGLPLSEKTARSRERTAMAFLAVASVTHSAGWSSAGGGAPLTSKQIIDFINQHFQESISKGSYDDLRRKDLAEAILAELVIPSAANPAAATNDPTRGCALAPELKSLIRIFGKKGWQKEAAAFMAERPSLAERLAGKSHFEPVPVELPGGAVISLSSGAHNLLQKAVVEQFLPRYGHGSKVVYIGDTARKVLYSDEALVAQLHITINTAAKIPDVIAFSPAKNWLYLIEAVHSFGPISNQRRLDLTRFASESGAGLVFVTAFLDINAFRKEAAGIGWETEVWIADQPDHLIHWNGDRFFGPR